MPIVLEVCPATTVGLCDTASGWGCVCNDTFGGPNCNVRSCPHCPLHSLCLERVQTSTLSGRASVRARGREPDVTGIPSAPLEPSPFMIRLRHHLARTTGVLAQHQQRGTVESRRGIRPSGCGSCSGNVTEQTPHWHRTLQYHFSIIGGMRTAGPSSLKTFSGRGCKVNRLGTASASNVDLFETSGSHLHMISSGAKWPLLHHGVQNVNRLSLEEKVVGSSTLNLCVSMLELGSLQRRGRRVLHNSSW